MSTSVSNVYAIGASRNIGYYSSLRFLESEATVTFLLRNPEVFANDDVIQNYVKQGRAILVKGDATVKEDIKTGWETALQHGNGSVDLTLFSVGGYPKFHLLKGITFTENLVTSCLLNLFHVLPPNKTKLVVISSKGITAAAHKSIPIMIKPVYGFALEKPHKDKIGAEIITSYLAGMPWDYSQDPEPSLSVMGSETWRTDEGMPKEGEWKDQVVVIRPALLTDGEFTGKYRTSYDESLGGYTISRKDVADLIYETTSKEEKWQEAKNQRIVVVY